MKKRKPVKHAHRKAMIREKLAKGKLPRQHFLELKEFSKRGIKLVFKN